MNKSESIDYLNRLELLLLNCNPIPVVFNNKWHMKFPPKSGLYAVFIGAVV